MTELFDLRFRPGVGRFRTLLAGVSFREAVAAMGKEPGHKATDYWIAKHEEKTDAKVQDVPHQHLVAEARDDGEERAD